MSASAKRTIITASIITKIVIKRAPLGRAGTIKISPISAKAARIPKKYRYAHEPEQVLGHE